MELAILLAEVSSAPQDCLTMELTHSSEEHLSAQALVQMSQGVALLVQLWPQLHNQLGQVGQ